MIDLAASHKHYLEHLLPVWREIPPEHKGSVFLPPALIPLMPGSVDYSAMPAGPNPVLVAGFDDVRRITGRSIILMEHGVGQSYGGDPISAHHGAYAGGDGRSHILGFLCPNEYAAARNRERYPDALTVVVGSPRLAALQTIPAPEPNEIPVVAFAFHWECTMVAESRSGWAHWVEAIRKLNATGDFKILGHAHPRMFRSVAPAYRDMGVEPVESFDEILMRADVLCCDNSSVLYEFAAVRGPVVVLDCPGYRPNVDHGLRFWDAADVGPRIIDPVGLGVSIRSALAKRPWPGAEERLARVFPEIGEPAKVAAEAAVEASMKSPSGGPPVRFPRTAPVG